MCERCDFLCGSLLSWLNIYLLCSSLICTVVADLQPCSLMEDALFLIPILKAILEEENLILYLRLVAPPAHSWLRSQKTSAGLSAHTQLHMSVPNDAHTSHKRGTRRTFCLWDYTVDTWTNQPLLSAVAAVVCSHMWLFADGLCATWAYFECQNCYLSVSNCHWWKQQIAAWRHRNIHNTVIRKSNCDARQAHLPSGEIIHVISFCHMCWHMVSVV